MDEYPTPELGIIESNGREDESIKEIETHRQKENECTQETLREAEDLTKKQTPLSIDLEADQPNAAQPRIEQY